MGAWGTGVFENDGAGDLLAELRHAEPERRAAVVREALRFAVEATDYLEVIEGQAAVAAAAVVAAGRNGTEQASNGWAQPLAQADLPSSTPEDVDLARLALARVVGDHSEWRELWEETAELDAALAAVAEVRTALA